MTEVQERISIMTLRERAIELFQKFEIKYKKKVMKQRSKRYFIAKKHTKILVALAIKEIKESN